MIRTKFNQTVFCLFLFLLCCCGCETIKKAREIQKGETRLPGESTLTSQKIGLREDQSYSLQDLEKIALKYHPTLFQATQVLEGKRIQMKMTRSSRYPHLNANGGYIRRSENREGMHPYSGTTSGSWSGSIGLDFLLYDFGKLNAEEQACVEDILAAEQQLRQQQIDVLHKVRISFFERLRKQSLLKVAEENVRQYAVHLNEAENMLRVGTRRKYDVTKAKVDWGNACLDLITASNGVITARAQLNAALGLADSPQFDLHKSIIGKEKFDLRSPDELMGIARENAPSLAVRRSQERAASADVDRTIADLFPELNLGGNLDLSGRSFPLLWNFSGMLKGAANLFDGKRNLAQIEQSVTALRRARSAVAEEEQKLYRYLVEAVAQRDSARESSATAKLVYDQAKENLMIVEEQYRIGTSSSIERTDAQVALTEAEAHVVTAFYDEQEAQAKITALIGEFQTNLK